MTESDWHLWVGEWKSSANPDRMYGLVYINLPKNWNKFTNFDATAVVDYNGTFKNGIRLQIPVEINLEVDNNGYHTMSMDIKVGPSKIQYKTSMMAHDRILGTYIVSFPKDNGHFQMNPSETNLIPYKENTCVVM